MYCQTSHSFCICHRFVCIYIQKLVNRSALSNSVFSRCQSQISHSAFATSSYLFYQAHGIGSSSACSTGHSFRNVIFKPWKKQYSCNLLSLGQNLEENNRLYGENRVSLPSAKWCLHHSSRWKYISFYTCPQKTAQFIQIISSLSNSPLDQTNSP